MSAALYESVARIARHEAGARATAGIGRVVDLFPADGPLKDHAVSVEMRDTGLVLPRVPVAVGVMGFAAIPAVDDLVLVVFADGDLHGAVVVGRLYHPDQEPPKHSRDQIALGLPSGADTPDLSLLVKSAEPSIELKLPGDVLLGLKDGEVAIQVGDTKLTLRGSGGGRAELASGDARITIKNSGDLTIETPGKLKLRGSEVEIQGDAKVKVQGAAVEIN